MTLTESTPLVKSMLSKSQYIRGLQCLKSLWLNKYHPDLREQSDAQGESLFEAGRSVGDLACEIFPGGVEIEFDPDDFEGMVAKTKQLINSGTEIIYEATFGEKGVFAMADILVKGEQGWDVYEVKASTNVKSYHLDDAAIQWYALSNVLSLNKAYIVHLNSDYVRNKDLDFHQLFQIEDVTEIVQTKQSAIPQVLAHIENMLQVTAEPVIPIGLQCNQPYACDFMGYCWRHIPTPSVFDLYRMSAQKKFELYQRGVVRYEDIPESESLNDTQAIQIKTALQNEEHIERSVVGEFLDLLDYPLNLFDFETFQEAIPRFEGQKPFMQMPFQYSLHIVHEDESMIHKEFLGNEHSDPREALVLKMLEDITPTGSIVAFNMAFEKSRFTELADAFPEYSDQLQSINERFVDLIIPFRQLGYYHPDFNGSFSIKSVLPAMFPDEPELDYKQLEIQDGGMAMDTFANLHKLQDQNQVDRLREALLAYCRLDTLAMVRILQKLKEIRQG